MTVSDRTCHEDLRTEKILKYIGPIKNYGALNFEFPAILLLKIRPKYWGDLPIQGSTCSNTPSLFMLWKLEYM